MSASRDELLDLSARARRSEASDEELKRLRAALGASATLRVAHQLGTDFDAELVVRPHDAELMDVIVAGALDRVAAARPPRARRRTAAWLLAAVALLMSVGALAVWSDALTAPTSPRVSPPPTAAPRVAVPSQRRAPALPIASAAPMPPAASALPVGEPLRPAAPPAMAATPSAAELFARANRARGEGRSGEAIETYRLLHRQHAASPEALTSRIALGRLLLAGGDAAAALHEFEQHLSGRGAMAEEALLWRARALGQLGRRHAESEAYRTLLERYPSTAYEREARRGIESDTEATRD